MARQKHRSEVLVGEPWPEIKRLHIEQPQTQSRLVLYLIAALILVPLGVSSLLLIAFAVFGMIKNDQTILGPLLTLASNVFAGFVGLVVGHTASRWRQTGDANH